MLTDKIFLWSESANLNNISEKSQEQVTKQTDKPTECAALVWLEVKVDEHQSSPMDESGCLNLKSTILGPRVKMKLA